MNKKHCWNPFGLGKTIGPLGSESGIIIHDEENSFGARIILEENGNIAPFSVTIGIYGLIFMIATSLNS